MDSVEAVVAFIEARIADDESFALSAQAEASLYDEGTVRWHWLVAHGKGSRWHPTTVDPARVLRQCGAFRRIVELHKSWPVLVNTPPSITPVETDPSRFAFRASQQIHWLTTQEYRARFGDEPPTAPMIAALASIWSDHPNYRKEWAA